jgi:coatomer subunit beta
MIISNNIQDIRYIRGATLRFLQRRQTPRAAPDLPLLPRTLSLLRRQKRWLCGYAIYLEFENLIPDAPELLQTFSAAESDVTCKRISFVFLAHCAMSKAVEWILSVYKQISGVD